MNQTPNQDISFPYRVTDGWLRDLAAQPASGQPWPWIQWDEQVLQDQLRFLDVQQQMGVNINVVWGLFISQAWPENLAQAAVPDRMVFLKQFVEAAHLRGVRVLSGVGVYSWGFREIIARHPEVAEGSAHAMCLHKGAAWDWQRRVFDFLMDPSWQLDGVSMQSADQGRCPCEACRRMTAAQYHAEVLVRSAEYLRANRPDWVIGQACWGLDVEDPSALAHLRAISEKLDYMVEVNEVPGLATRPERIRAMRCAYGTVGGVFIEPPQHWDRLRYFVPCGLGSADSLRRLWKEGGRACEYFYRPFANPGDEVSWRTGARILSYPEMLPRDSLRLSVEEVYGVSGSTAEELTRLYERAEEAYFSRSSFRLGSGPLSLEPLIWELNPCESGPAVYLSERLTPAARTAYSRDLRDIRESLHSIDLPNLDRKANTLACIDGTLCELEALA